MNTALINQEDSNTQHTFAPIPNWILRRKEISHGAKNLYARLKQYAGKSGVAFPKRETLAEELGTHIRAIDRFTKELTKNNLVVIRQVGCNRPNEYTFPSHIWMKGSQTYGCTKMYTPECTKMYTPYKDEKIIRKYNIKQKDSDIERDQDSDDFREEFEEWFEVYPRKQERGKAYFAFLRAKKHASFEILVRKAKSYARYRERCISIARGKDYNSNQDLFTRLPHTWLENHCWLDDYGHDEVKILKPRQPMGSQEIKYTERSPYTVFEPQTKEERKALGDSLGDLLKELRRAA